uniref:SMP-30/Gluconolactonase/LRE-like region domain-containing protein n=1 Tax=Chromera velia CCMP2878 TaxID=1169474 RepID=A0A0G4FYH1_9ALVE|eukprot:Cvel_19318.t1-p1 / transcript=Cvel_19318.t1 / gene=Cvel_19318 / organism=Chromera_velia_CCMP2878 / gene_product=hypothetical protein / transcript_product=hypothetical protein / location=Cvel_scaffold1656:13534-18155(-) / protein_length=757 / sequence_SO=supercontig / SO=protein_coding / is_pseudo=false
MGKRSYSRCVACTVASLFCLTFLLSAVNADLNLDGLRTFGGGGDRGSLLGGFDLPSLFAEKGKLCQGLSGTVPATNSEDIFEVSLYALVQGGPSKRVASTRSTAEGTFRLSTCKGDFLIAVPADSNISKQALGAVLLPPEFEQKGTVVDVVINEPSTVATAFALAQFAQADPKDGSVWIGGGSLTGMRNAARLSANYIDPSTGSPTSLLSTSPNGPDTDTLERLNSLANAISLCRGGGTSSGCYALVELTGTTNSFLAISTIAANPAVQPDAVYAITEQASIYSPALSTAPAEWTLPLLLTDTGSATKRWSGPGNVAIDAKGNLWGANNYIFQTSDITPAVPSDYYIALKPSGEPQPFSPGMTNPKGGTGPDGPGFGASIDLDGFPWQSNNVFGSPDNDAGSIFKIDPKDGRVIGTWDFDTLMGKGQGIVPDRLGNMFVASLGTNELFKFNPRKPEEYKIIRGNNLDLPFGVAVDSQNNVWVANSAPAPGSTFLSKFSNDGEPLGSWELPNGTVPEPPPPQQVADTGASAKGVAIDLQDNVYVANWLNNSISVFQNDGTDLGFFEFGEGLEGPWGVAVDAFGDIFIGEFGTPLSNTGKGVAHICGAASTRPGCFLGKLLSPATGGYAQDTGVMQRVTGVTIAESGAVWACNNWKPQPTDILNPGGNGLVLFPGLAKPVKTPLYGPPRLPTDPDIGGGVGGLVAEKEDASESILSGLFGGDGLFGDKGEGALSGLDLDFNFRRLNLSLPKLGGDGGLD